MGLPGQSKRAASRRSVQLRAVSRHCPGDDQVPELLERQGADHVGRGLPRASTRSVRHGFPHILPHIRESIETTIVNPLNTNGSVAISFSSGPYYTLHADVFEAWEQSRINFLLHSNGII